MIRVNDTHFDEGAILQEMQYHPAENQRNAMIKASESLIISELIKQRAKALGIKAAVESEDDDDTFSAQLFDREVDMPGASEQDCRLYFDNNREKFCSSPLLAVRHILLAVNSEDELARIEAEDKAKLIIRQLCQDPNQFSVLASLHSDCPSKKTEGQLGQISKGQTVPEFERQLFNCELGLVLQSLPSRYGVHIVFIDQRVEGRPLEFVMVKERISDYLNERVRRKAIAQYIETLIAKADIDGFDFSVSDSPLVQ